MKKHYTQWVKENITNLSSKDTVLLLGATGGLGSSLAEYLCLLNVNLVLAGRNIEQLKLLKEKLNKDSKSNISIAQIDFEDVKSVKEFISNVSNINFNYVLNVAGIYHLPFKKDGKYERTQLVNFLMPSYLIKNLLNLNPKLKVVNCGSVSYKWISFKNLQNEKILENRSKSYYLSKRLLMEESIYLAYSGYDVCVAHPGASFTNLFNKKNKAYNKLFYVFVTPLMKVIFMSPDKASLSLLLALNGASSKTTWYGPKGLLNLWGYPKQCKISSDMFNENNLNVVNRMVEDFIKDQAE